jgi:predicted RNase H-like nuclease (RuvC/YqgF family)
MNNPINNLMNHPNVTIRSAAREKMRLERKVRDEQVVKNDAWLRADAVYREELDKKRKEIQTLEEELARKNDLVDNLAKALRSLTCSDGKTAVHFRFLD